MKIHQLRSATCVIESHEQVILVDPMLGPEGSIPPFSYFRFKPLRNPLKDLPLGADTILDKVTHCLITHSQKWGIKALQHTDHLDAAGQKFLCDRQIPVTTLARDATVLRKYGLRVETGLEFWQPASFLGGAITAVPARHGHSWIHRFMANGAGYFLALPDAPSVYISGDTVYTSHVARVLSELKPDVSIMAAGTATLDVSRPILMPVDELIRFVRTAPGKVLANHLEALNHCPTTRAQLARELEKNGLLAKTYIPDDGEVIFFEKES